MDIISKIQLVVSKYLRDNYGQEVESKDVLINVTKKEFEGDYTVVIFPFVKMLKLSPAAIGEAIGLYLKDALAEVIGYNIVQGFVNISLSNSYWKGQLSAIRSNDSYGRGPVRDTKVMVEFASPNTNKPLHLGHIRNILLGWSCAQILEYAGYDTIKTQIINDRGIAVCKSMLAWQKYGNSETPESSGKKGDHLVGAYYVLFDQKIKEEYSTWQSSSEGQSVFQSLSHDGESKEDFFKRYKNQYFNDYSILGNEAKDMLLAWEAGDEAVVQLWMMMNSWVYDGFNTTYANLGVHFDKLYYESDTYLLGRDTVEKGLKNGVFYKENDGSVWIDLTDANMDKKIVLRSDGTSVYMTQDIGTAQIRYGEFGMQKMVYVVADEQDYHFKVLFEILKRLKEPFAEGLFHLSYGMVELPTGRMKSREGTVVDADDLMQEVISEAKASSEERGEIAEMDLIEREDTIKKIGMAALKFMMIKVNPKRKMTFDPKESVDMQGQTGPYVQNAYVRVQSVLRKHDGSAAMDFDAYTDINEFELSILKLLVDFPSIIEEAAHSYDPSGLANYCYNLAKEYHRFYHEVRILTAETEEAKSFRLVLSEVVARTLKQGMLLLGIDMPDRM